MKHSESNGSNAIAIPEASTSATRPEQESSASKRPYVPDEAQPPANPLKDKSTAIFAGALVAVVLLLLTLRPLLQRRAVHRSAFAGITSTKTPGTQQNEGAQPGSGSIIPLTDTGQAEKSDLDRSMVHPDQIGGTANRAQQGASPTKLGDIRPVDRAWEPAPYQPGADTRSENQPSPPSDAAEKKNERDAMDKASLVFVRTKTGDGFQSGKPENASTTVDLGVGLPPGTKLRARLESAATTAIQMPVVAAVEYNYERDGEIIVPAGTKAFGHLESADRSGYIGVRFDSMELPDGSTVKLDASATDLELRPLKGKVEGKHTGKNVLVRSFAGVGEIAAALAGRGSLNQPLSESDLLRERVSNNIGQASDEEIARLTVTERLVVTVPANTEIYVVLEKPATEVGATRIVSRASAAALAPRTANLEELRQLLQLQRELNQNVTNENSNQQ
jgi:hypothetical protein